MKIKKLLVMKEECETKIKSLELAIGFASAGVDTVNYELPKITLTTEQASDIHDLLLGYKKLLDMVIDSAEVDIG